jgi:hypothetical protein
MDVSIIQKRLNELVGVSRQHLVVDGRCGRKTIGMIADFQRSVLNFRRPDSRVDPAGRTIVALNAPNSATAWQTAIRVGHEDSHKTRPSIKTPTKCQRHELMIPTHYEQFLKDVRRWISTCVASRTKTARGVPIEREHELVDSNSSLRSVWGVVQRFAGTGELITVRAKYMLTGNTDENIRVKEIVFSTDFLPPPPIKTVPIKTVPKETTSKLNELGKLLSIQLRWANLRTTVNSQIRRRNRAQQNVSDLEEGDSWWMTLANALGRDPADSKVDARAKLNQKEVSNNFRRELEDSEFALQNALYEIKSLEAELFLLMGELEFKKWFAAETSMAKSPLYPAR